MTGSWYRDGIYEYLDGMSCRFLYARDLLYCFQRQVLTLRPGDNQVGYPNTFPSSRAKFKAVPIYML